MLKRIRNRASVVGLMVLGAILMALPAFATPATTESVIEDGFSEMSTLLTGTLAVAFFGITAIVLAIVVGWKWLRRGAKQG